MIPGNYIVTPRKIAVIITRRVSVHGVTEHHRGATEVAEKQGQKERRQGPDGRREGGKPPSKCA